MQVDQEVTLREASQRQTQASPMMALLGPVSLVARKKADLVVCDTGWQAVLIASLILMVSAKTSAKSVWADLRLLS